MGVHLYTNGAWTDSGKIYRNSAQLISEIVQGGVSVDGSLSDNTTRVRTAFIPVTPSTTYSVSSGNLYLAVGCYYNNNAFASQINDIVALTTSVTFTVPENANQIVIGFRSLSGSTIITPSDLQNYMLNVGSTVLPYEPYNVVDWYENNGHGYSSGAWS